MYSKSIEDSYYFWESYMKEVAFFVFNDNLLKTKNRISEYYAIYISYLLIF